jgi:aminoglycoside phosphotransferase (APT) family kinase protein
MEFILKDLSPDRLLANARNIKPAFLHEPRRELECYRGLLAPAGIGPSCAAAVTDGEHGRQWLLLEKVPGVELWQIGELSVWEQVAQWLGKFHAFFAWPLDELRARNPYLLEHSRSWFRDWCERARSALACSRDRRAAAVRRSLDHYDVVASALAALPRTLVHGELYPSNVLVTPQHVDVRIYPVDWEMAAIGPGLMDLAALSGGWESDERRRLVAAYLRTAPGEAREVEAVTADLARCRLHLALQWLGWSSEWTPPKEHARDWLGEALLLSHELKLL